MPRLTLLLLLRAALAAAREPWNVEGDYTTITAGGVAQAGLLDGGYGNATFRRPNAVAIDGELNELYVADKGNHAIRKVRVSLLLATQEMNESTRAASGIGPELSDDYVTTLAGSGVRGFRDGIGAAARFNEPSGLALDPFNRLLFIADQGNSVIRQINLDTRRVTTIAGSPGNPGFINGKGRAAAFRRPMGLTLALRSRQLFVCDSYNHAIRVVNVATREVRTLAGSGILGSADGIGDQATFNLPVAAAVDDLEQTLYVVDLSPRIRSMNTRPEPSY